MTDATEKASVAWPDGKESCEEKKWKRVSPSDSNGRSRPNVGFRTYLSRRWERNPASRISRPVSRTFQSRRT